ncbi:thymidine phosphorylase family protein [Candidatus Viadribacter manganicus]|uniref:Putative thymidine phosphorylase n=1 Tax=Candidatus Viadribacter manganicus TaxID=1759059 RepID=A0A1B1AGG2_9PROT|nr:thymidine phosphorylase family protein [Candidatus Viadribacter manganicus]ANP45643.1 thymidine phosphorylase [Candidatus Viadribacter manganicus]
MNGQVHPLRARRLGLLTQDEAIVLMRTDCHVCKSEGLAARARVLVRAGTRELIATLYQIENEWLHLDEVGLSEAAWRRLDLKPGEVLDVENTPSVDSLADVRHRIYGGRLDARAFGGIITDIVAGRYADIHLATFIAACSAFPLDVEEITHLTGAMADAGDRLSWGAPVVSDKHCVGGLPGNRTTPIVVAIAASCGLIMPKTSSRAITSPSGTADAMETLAPVDLDVSAMRRVVEAEGGCIAWGGAVKLSPADDVLIRVERALEIDTEGQLIASVLSKKIAAGATHVVLDLPVGPTAKVRTERAAENLTDHICAVASSFGMKTRVLRTDGAQPVGRGIGPALEARDVLAVLKGEPQAPQDLRMRALAIAAAVLELSGAAPQAQGAALAEEALASGRAWTKFQRICAAQGGMRTPPVAPLRRALGAPHSGIVTHINNRKISRLAKLAGAPDDKAAGLEILARLGDQVMAGAPLLIVHAEAPGELDYALGFAAANMDMFEIEA